MFILAVRLVHAFCVSISYFFFFSSRRRHTRLQGDWSSDVCSSDLLHSVPNNAFTLNNIGYVAELEGDRETAQFFYDHARQAGGANLTVGVATRRSDEGKKLFAVAADNDTKVEAKVTEDRNTLRRQPEPVVLRRRDNSIVNESEPETAPADNTQP